MKYTIVIWALVVFVTSIAIARAVKNIMYQTPSPAMAPYSQAPAMVPSTRMPAMAPSTRMPSVAPYTMTMAPSTRMPSVAPYTMTMAPSFAPSRVPVRAPPAPSGKKPMAVALPPKPAAPKTEDAASAAKKYLVGMGFFSKLVVISEARETRKGGETVRVTIQATDPRKGNLVSVYVVDASRGFGAFMIPTPWSLTLVSGPSRSPAPRNCTKTGPWSMTKMACVDKMYRSPLWTAEMSPVLTYPPQRRCVQVPVDCNGPKADPSANLYSSEAECKKSCLPPLRAEPPLPREVYDDVTEQPNCAYDANQKYRTFIGCPPNSSTTVYSYMSGVCTPVERDCNGPRGGPAQNVFPTMAACRSSCDPLPR